MKMPVIALVFGLISSMGGTTNLFKLVRPTPTPTPRAQSGGSGPVDCSRFNPANGQATLTVNLVVNQGQAIGDTVVRLKPTGTCPGESAAIEHWLSSGQLSWTSSPVNPGRYRLEIANGNYQGVIVKTVDMYSGSYTMSVSMINR